MSRQRACPCSESYPLLDDQVSALMRALYIGVGACAEKCFGAYALEQLRELLPFDKGHWRGGGYEIDTGGKTGAEGDVLNLRWWNRISGLEDVLILRRDAARPPFSELERDLLAFLMPHLVESAGRDLLHGLQVDAGGSSASLGVGAICDLGGSLHSASDAFIALLLLECPDWCGPRLPWGMAGKREIIVVKGKRIVVHCQPSEGLIHLRARRRAPVDELSEAELRVARELAVGASYKSAARELGVSPSTINNHAANLYCKLGIKSKAELAALWPQLMGGTD